MESFLHQLGDTFVAILTFFISTIYAGKAMRRCKELNLNAEVNERSAHKNTTPTGGGYSFVVTCSLFAAVWINFFAAEHFRLILNVIFGLGAVVAYIGWLDDTKNLNPLLRLSCQVFICALTTYFMPTLTGNVLPLWAEKTLIFLGWVWFLNLYNFMDGIDGIAATQTAFIAGFLFFVFPEVKTIAIVIASCMIGFLRFNWHPARIFMGDVGSTYLGFILGGLLLLNLTQGFSNSFYAGLIITLVFVGDTTFTLIKRLLKGKKPWQAHKDHFYQRAVHNLGLSHSQVVKRIIILNSIFLVLAILSQLSHFGLYFMSIALSILILVAIRIRYLEGK